MDSIKINISCIDWNNPKRALDNTLILAKAANKPLTCKFKMPYLEIDEFDITVWPSSDIKDLWRIYDLEFEKIKYNKQLKT